MAITDAALYKKLQEAKTHTGNNYISQIANARESLGALKGMDGISAEQANKMQSAFNSEALSGTLGMVGAIGNGLGSIASTAMDAASTADLTQQNNTVAQMGQIGRGNYGSFDDIQQDYTQLGQLGNSLDYSYDTVRGKSNGELAGDVLSTTATGAMTGLQVGGPWGALAGAVVGLGAGLGGVFTGNAKAKMEASLGQANANRATAIAQQNINTNSDNLRNSNFNNAFANRAARGGQLEKKTLNVKEFSEMVLNRQRQADRTRSLGIVRQHCKGGTMIRIKR